MIKKKLCLLLATVMTASVLTTGFSNGVVAHASTTRIVESVKDNDQIILTDLQYEQKGSYTKWRDINKNANIDGNPIKLKLFGEITQFKNGIGAHAESSIVYNVAEHTNRLTHLRGYAGVDVSMGNKGNGVIFSIQVSQDGQKWEEKFVSGIVKGNSECIVLDVNVKGAKFVKLLAKDNGGNGNDHAVYGDLKLVDATKDEAKGLKIKGIKTVEEYDNELKNGDAVTVAESKKLLVYQRELVNRVGYHALNNLFAMNPDYQEGMKYFFNSEKALSYYIEAGTPDGGSQAQVLLNFAKIYKKYKQEIEKDQDFLLKLAVSIGLSHSKQVAFWMGNAKPHDPVQRFESYKYLVEKGIMDETREGDGERFKKLPSALMQFTTNARLHEDEVIWLAEYSLSKRDAFKDKNHLNAYNYINYTFNYKYDKDIYYDDSKKEQWDKEFGVSKFEDYGQKGIVRNFMIFKEGAVCGGLAKTYTTLSEVFGRPAQVVHQPGHAAAIVYDIDKEGKPVWNLMNDVFGWAQSRDEMGQMPLTWGMKSWNSDRSASYVVLAQRNLDEYENYAKAVRLNIMADVYKEDNAKAEALYKKALEIQPRQLDSMFGLINTFKANDKKTGENYVDLARQITRDFKYYPLAMVDLMRLIEGEVSGKDKVTFDLLKANALVDASNSTDSDVRQSHIARTIANSLLGKEKTDLATFSFDGENANKIIINPDYNESGIMVRYSLDGGDSFQDTSEHSIDLKNRLSEINAEDDILVGLVGTKDVFKIDIQKATSPTTKLVKVNDLENKFIGNTKNLQWSIDGQNNWKDYNNGVFSGEATIFVRYKANGIFLASDSVSHKFTASKDTAQRKYVPLNNFEIFDVSSSEETKKQAVNLIDGNEDTSFVSTNQGDGQKFVTLKLKEAKYISSVEYIPHTQKGRITELEVQVSMDGKTFKPVKTEAFVDGFGLRTINFDSVRAQYIKLVANKTSAPSQNEHNLFISGREFRFYEDETMKEIELDVSDDNTTIVAKDKGGNIVEGKEGKIDWIKTRTKLDGVATVAFSRIDTGKFKDPVTVYLIEPDKNMEILNHNDIKYTFEKNGTFVFKLRNKTTDEIKFIPVKVDWILE